MRSLMRFAFALLLALPVFAQNDQSIVIERVEGLYGDPATRVAVGAVITYWVRYDAGRPELYGTTVLEVTVPGTVTELVTGNQIECTTAGSVRCTFPTFHAPRWDMFIHVQVAQPGAFTSVAKITNSTVPDPNPANNTSTFALEAFARPSFRVRTYRSPERLDPGQRGLFSIEIDNRSPWPATNIVFTATLPAGGAFASYDSGACTVESGALVCTRPSLNADGYFYVTFEVTAPERTDGEDFVAHITVTADEGDVDPADNEITERIPLVRQFVVTSVADEGGGSLRQAIHDVNALCPVPKPCGIAFRIPAPVPEAGWFTIQPRTPLPDISGSVKVDGKTQTFVTGDTNPDGPEIEINGALVSEGSGLRLLSDCEKDVRGLAVNGFPGYGIEIRRVEVSPCGFVPQKVVENYLGTDPRGRIAKPNQRGVGLFGLWVTAEENLISGNLRSGVYAAGTYFVDVAYNRIGVTASGTPLGNGASGVFLDVLPGSTGNVRDNVIANSAHWAVARTGQGELEIVRNSIFDNVLQGIDFNLDLRTPNRQDDIGMPNHPVLYSAAYDPVRNATVVRGRLDSEGARYFPNFTIHVYASARLSIWGLPQAERLVARQEPAKGRSDFEIVVPLDLRGQWITATNTVSHYSGWSQPVVTHESKGPRGDAFDLPTNTSELSDAVLVH